MDEASSITVTISDPDYVYALTIAADRYDADPAALVLYALSEFLYLAELISFDKHVSSAARIWGPSSGGNTCQA